MDKELEDGLLSADIGRGTHQDSEALRHVPLTTVLLSFYSPRHPFS